MTSWIQRSIFIIQASIINANFVYVSIYTPAILIYIRPDGSSPYGWQKRETKTSGNCHSRTGDLLKTKILFSISLILFARASDGLLPWLTDTFRNVSGVASGGGQRQ